MNVTRKKERKNEMKLTDFLNKRNELNERYQNKHGQLRLRGLDLVANEVFRFEFHTIQGFSTDLKSGEDLFLSFNTILNAIDAFPAASFFHRRSEIQSFFDDRISSHQEEHYYTLSDSSEELEMNRYYLTIVPNKELNIVSLIPYRISELVISDTIQLVDVMGRKKLVKLSALPTFYGKNELRQLFNDLCYKLEDFNFRI